MYKEMALKSRQLEVEVTKYKEKMNEMDYLSKRVEVKDRLEKELEEADAWEGWGGGVGEELGRMDQENIGFALIQKKL